MEKDINIEAIIRARGYMRLKGGFKEPKLVGRINTLKDFFDAVDELIVANTEVLQDGREYYLMVSVDLMILTGLEIGTKYRGYEIQSHKLIPDEYITFIEEIDMSNW